MKFEITARNTPPIKVEGESIQFVTYGITAGHVASFTEGTIIMFFTEPIERVYRHKNKPHIIWINGCLPDVECEFIYQREKIKTGE